MILREEMQILRVGKAIMSEGLEECQMFEISMGPEVQFTLKDEYKKQMVTRL